MKYAILFIPSGSYLRTIEGFKFPKSALYSEEEEIYNIEILFFSSKEDALQIFNKEIWKTQFVGEADFIIFNNEKYFITKDPEFFEIIEIEEE